MVSFICKIYGAIDLITALIFILGFYSLPGIIKFPIIIVLMIKGVPSLMADFIGKIYGVIDLLAAAFIFFNGLPVPDFLKLMVISILLFKGILSMLG